MAVTPISTLLLVMSSVAVLGEEWVSSSNGFIPSHAFSGETNDDNHNALYICKGMVENTVACGKTNTYLGNCRIPFNFKEYTLSSGYEVLTMPPWGEYTLEWTDDTYSNGKVPSGAVSAAEGVYVGRYEESNHYYLLGKVVPRRNNFFYSDNGKEYYKTTGYEVLVAKLRQIDHYELYDVVYNLAIASQTISPESILLAEKNVQNKSPFDTTSTLSMEITQSTSSEWTEMNSFEIHTGLKITVSAGIPLFGQVSTEWEIGISSTSSYSYGESYTTSESTGHDISVNLPPYSDVKVSMIAKEANIDVPYTATLKIFFADGGTYERNGVAGVYKNVHYTSYDSVIDSVPFNDTNVSGAIKRLLFGRKRLR